MTSTAKPTPWDKVTDETLEVFYEIGLTPRQLLERVRVLEAKQSRENGLLEEAAVVYEETTLTPRQLLEQRDELVELLESYLRILRHHMHALTADDQTIENCLFDGKKALAKCGKVGE